MNSSQLNKFIKVDTPLREYFTYEKYIMDSLPLIGNALHKAEMGYCGKFVHTIGSIQHIDIMGRIDICYTTCHLATQTVAPTLPILQGIQSCVKYMARHPP